MRNKNVRISAIILKKDLYKRFNMSSYRSSRHKFMKDPCYEYQTQSIFSYLITEVP